MIGVIGDLHFKDSLGYADYIKDRRLSEKKETLDFIVESLKDCDHIVFMGDQLNGRNNSSEVIREFVAFLERFGKKDLYLLRGNHETSANGKSALDFLKELNKVNWHICTTKLSPWPLGEYVVDFLPYSTKAELGVKENSEATSKIMRGLKGADILFHHHAMSDTQAGTISTNIFDEPVLPRKKLAEKYGLVVGGHIHTPTHDDNVIVTGSIFCNEVGEMDKYIWKIGKKLKVEQIRLPGRAIFKFENPTIDYVKKAVLANPHNIVKVIITDKNIKINELKEELSKYDAYLIVEQYPRERTKVHIEGALDFNIENLLEIYAKEKEVDLEKLMKGLELVRT
jgi:hypothetical protein